jgi:hypothetical protein
MLMRFMWGLAIGHTYTWKDQPGESPYYAGLDNLVRCLYAQPAMAEPPPQASTSTPSSRGILAPVFSWTNSRLERDSLNTNEEEYSDDGEGWEDEVEGNPEDLEDEWDLRNDEEVITYDDMYQDWYLYDG